MSTATLSDPYPVKLDHASRRIASAIKSKTHLSRSDILRRAVQYSLPKFLSGEVDILTVVPPKSETEKKK